MVLGNFYRGVSIVNLKSSAYLYVRWRMSCKQWNALLFPFFTNFIYFSQSQRKLFASKALLFHFFTNFIYFSQSQRKLFASKALLFHFFTNFIYFSQSQRKLFASKIMIIFLHLSHQALVHMCECVSRLKYLVAPMSSPGLDGHWLRPLPLTGLVFRPAGCQHTLLTQATSGGSQLSHRNSTKRQVYIVPAAESRVWYDCLL